MVEGKIVSFSFLSWPSVIHLPLLYFSYLPSSLSSFCCLPRRRLWGVPRFQPLSEEEIDAINLGGAGIEDRQGPGQPSYIWAMELTMKPNPALSDQKKKKSSVSSSGRQGKGSEGEKKMSQKN